MLARLVSMACYVLLSACMYFELSSADLHMLGHLGAYDHKIIDAIDRP